MTSPEGWQAFDGRADFYSRRWDYATEAIDAILAITRLGQQSTVADLGAGTGMVSRHFAQRVGRVVAIEPNAQMRAVATEQLRPYASTDVVAGVAHATGLSDQSVDMVAAGRALHWFDPGPTQREIRRILRPGGWLAVLQVRATDPGLSAEMTRLHEVQGGWGVPDHGHHRTPIDPSDYFGGADFMTLRFPGHVAEAWPEFFERLLSFSWAPRPTQPEYADFERLARQMFDRRAVAGTVGIDNATEVLIKQIVAPGRPVHKRQAAGSRLSASDAVPAAPGPSPLPSIDPEGSVAARFELAVRRLPDQIAICTDDVQWSFVQLNRLGNQIAHRVLEASPDPARPVAMVVEDVPTAVATMLGVLKAGRAYCPLSPSQPPDRLRETLAELRPAVLLCDADRYDTAAPWSPGGCRIVGIDPARLDGPADDLGLPSAPDSLAAIHFTSGSTGRPKGILRSQRFILHRAMLDTGHLSATPADQVTLLFDIAFSAAAGDIFVALLNGATLHPYSLGRHGLRPLAGWLRRRGITLFHLPVALFRQFVDGLQRTDRFPTVRRVTPSGKLRWPDVEAYRRHFSADCRLVAQLASTETSLLTLMLVDHATPSAGDSVPVGHPVDGKEIWLVDERGKRVDDGRAGEIVVRSRYLFTGVWGDTATPEGPDNREARTYHTGDLGRWLPDGSLEFLGRRDSRVKVRGFRVDLAEIEAGLLGTGLASQAAVFAEVDRGHDLQIIAYVKPAAIGINGGDLRAALAQRVPDYMLPAHFVLVDALPLTANGKVDRAALPGVGGERPDLNTAWTPPRTDVEAELCAIWSDVLGIDRVGVDDHFLDLGGNSLQATLILTRALRAFDVDLPHHTLSLTPTVAQMAVAILSAREDSHVTAGAGDGPTSTADRPTGEGRRAGRRERPAIIRLAERSMAPLSFAQQRMWFLDQLEPEHAIYNMPGAYRLRGPLDAPALERSLTEILRRHEVLRTVIVAESGRPKPVIQPSGPLAVPVVDLRGLPESSRLGEAFRLADQERLRPFDLAADPMLRAKVWRLGDEDHLLLVTQHHIASDAWSFGVFWQELGALYAAWTRGDPDPASALPGLPIQYGDFAAWQHVWLQGDVLEEQLAYWRDQLADLTPLELPTDRPRPATQRYRGAIHRFTLGADLAAALRGLSRQCGTTLYMTLLAAFQVLLYRHSGQDDIAVGTPVANRDQIQLESLIGFFANTLVLRGDLSGNPSFRAFLGRVRHTAIGAFEHQSLPFEQLVAELKPERRPDRHPLFQVLFQVLSNQGSTPHLAGLRVQREQLAGAAARFDLELTLRETPTGFNGSLIYCADLFEAATVERLMEHFVALLHAAVADPECAVARLPMMAEVERQQVLRTWNATATDYPRDRCIHLLFEDEVRRAPDRVALIFAERRLTYDELNKAANRAARALRAAGMQSRDIVGVCLPRSPDLIVALLAILKAGGAYLPLDPTHPAGRIRDMLADAGARIVLTHSSLLDRLPADLATPMFVDALPGLPVAAAGENLPCDATAEDLAYVMYTSGSTGRPKGVEIRHRSVNRLVYGLDVLGTDWHRSVLHLAPIAFDASTFEIWGPLLHGGCLVIAPDGLPDLAEVEALIRRHGIRTLWLTAGLFNSIVETRPQTLDEARMVLTGGEALSVRHVRLAQACWPNLQLVNGYGPTEGTTFTCCFPIPRPLPPDARTVPIGRPIANTRVVVLDRFQEPVPIGVSGELFIGGDGLARGYQNQASATAASFVADPFTAGERLYRTGDRVRWRSDGTLEFLGRYDDQAKIRGYRVEPGEVAAVLGGHPNIVDCAVIAREDSPGDTRLAAYCVARDGGRLAERELAEYLRARVPAYMMPMAFVQLDHLPLNANGKLDRWALPAPRAHHPHLPENPAAGNPVVDNPAPTGAATARILQGIWESLLGVRHVGLDDSFFDLGGHSLLAVQLFARIEARFGRRLPLGLLFERPTIRHLTSALDDALEHNEWGTLVSIQPQGRRPPFFCVHGFGGGVLGYADLAQQLGPDQPFYGLQASGLDGEAKPDESIDSMAARYVGAMREHQPNGPYRIGGYCFGGVVALEMARQLEEVGEEVALLAIIEGYPPARSQHHGYPFELARLSAIWRNIPFWCEDYLSLGMTGVGQRLRRKLRQLDLRLGRATSTAPIPSPQSFVDDDLTLLPEHHFELVRLHVGALRSYRPRPYGGTITLFTARGWTISKVLFGSLDPYHGWNDLASGRVTLHLVDGGHRNLHLRPHVSSLAAALASCLGEVAGPRRANEVTG